ncbi:hypothetical protein Pint_24007 [Pistacia integerrima]|uniref:Uncharacterized protein n=1 Tax=Pistacia integerrima TaxID=434235 RepID=A0ACC0YMK7_9ROSI|nr:hypothetical protein Pint_24007 [Pistacia integerrima]
MKKWRDTYEVASRGMEKFAASFDKSEDRSQCLFAEIEELGLLTLMQTIDVLEVMCKDQHKIDVFMGLPKSLKRTYVLCILDKSSHMSSRCIFCRSPAVKRKATSRRAFVIEHKGKKSKAKGKNEGVIDHSLIRSLLSSSKN